MYRRMGVLLVLMLAGLFAFLHFSGSQTVNSQKNESANGNFTIVGVTYLKSGKEKTRLGDVAINVTILSGEDNSSSIYSSDKNGNFSISIPNENCTAVILTLSKKGFYPTSSGTLSCENAVLNPLLLSDLYAARKVKSELEKVLDEYRKVQP